MNNLKGSASARDRAQGASITSLALAAVVLCVGMGGCATQKPTVTYILPADFAVRVEPDTQVWADWATYPHYTDWSQGGTLDTSHPYEFYDPSSRTVVVRWDGDHPDFEALGHGIWHAIAGRFHAGAQEKAYLVFGSVYRMR